MDDRKHFTFLESASPFVFFTETFSNPKDFRNAKVEFFNNGLNANQRAVLALKYTRTAEVFFKAVFRNKEQMEYFFAGLDERGAVQEYEIALNGELTSNRWCQISSRIIRSNNGEYQLQGFLVSLQRVKELEKTLSEENALLETILSGIGDAVCVYDQNKKIIFQSPLH